MNTIRFNKGNVKLVAHRGLSGIETENTCAAFIAAGNRDYYGIETDARVTADGKFVLMHDDTMVRVSGVELNIAECNYAALRSVSLKEKNGQPRGDLRIASLEEYLRLCARYEKVCVLELKGFYSCEKLAEMADMIREVYAMEKVVFIAFSYETCVNVRSVVPEAKIQYLTSKENVDEALIAKLKAYSFDLDIYYKQLTKENIALLHENNIEVNCWTVDDPAKAEELASWGIDYITTNILQ